jgi:O-acetyl-ADP-ribose deacetylase (regulator of RNase III)
MTPAAERIVADVGTARRVLQLYQGDITLHVSDALVNAANQWLAGGGGVDGAIHRRGGAAIMQETRSRYPHGCPTGSAVITTAGQLPARFVIHAVGPVWNGGTSGEPQLLQSAYTSSLELAAEHGCRSIAFPSLSTGAYRYPIDQAAQIALSCCWEFLSADERLLQVRFVLFDEPALQVFQDCLQRL